MSSPPNHPPTSATVAPSDARLVSLDGLRGLAALVVVFHHLSLTFAPIANVFFDSKYPRAGSAGWWLTVTPLQLLVAGPEAVLVFFVLSGVVLSLPVIRRLRGFDWFAYYPRRVIRLYLPAMAAVALAAVWVLATSWTSGPATSQWVAVGRFRGFDFSLLLSGWDLLFGNPALDNPLWTLRWEVLFSLILPVIVVVAVMVRRWWWIAGVACTALVYVGVASGIEAFRYLPVFVLGALIASHHDRIRDWSLVPTNSRLVRWGGIVVLLLSLLFLNLHWTAIGMAGGVAHGQAYLIALEPVGATGLVLLAAYWPPAKAMLRTPFFHWLGRISFSVYLVHVPIIDAMDAVFGFWAPALRVVVSFALAFGIAELFSRFVEQPSHRLAKSAGAAATAQFQRFIGAKLA